MAQLPKPIAAPAAASSFGRVGHGARVAAFNSGVIDEGNASTALSLDAAPPGFDDRPRFDETLRQERGEQRRQQAFDYGRLFTADSSVFASILERPDEAPSDNPHRPVGEGATVGRAISTYETNARVITGTNPLSGTEFSISL